MKRTPQFWSSKADEALLQLKEEGRSCSEIAHTLQSRGLRKRLSAKAVYAHLYDLQKRQYLPFSPTYDISIVSGQKNHTFKVSRETAEEIVKLIVKDCL